MKILSMLCLFLGEALSVWSEMIAAREHDRGAGSIATFSKSFLWIALAGAFLIGGYMLGYRAFRSIWVVSVVSITSILAAEPFLAITMFSEMPSKGALIGFIAGVLGLVAALTIK
jgi:hypothetical protein